MDVAFIGLGQMGSSMAGQLIEAGHRLTVWNRDPAKGARFAQRGASIAIRPKDAARAGIVMTMLANDDAVEAVVFRTMAFSRRKAASSIYRAAPSVSR